MKRSTQMFADASTRRPVEPAAAPELYPSLRDAARAQLAFLFRAVMQAEARRIARQLAPVILVAVLAGCQSTPRPATTVPLLRVFQGSIRCESGHLRVTRRPEYPILPDLAECVQ